MGVQARYCKCVMVAMLFAITGCDKLTEASRSAQAVSKHAFDDTKASWTDFFTYHPPVPDALPQTRYCYHMQSDVVCYDSEQPRLTSKLVGYQDGENISWVQPGGGSLGASGGEPVALRPLAVAAPAGTVVRKNAMASNTVAKVPFSTGQISVKKLPPKR